MFVGILISGICFLILVIAEIKKEPSANWQKDSFMIKLYDISGTPFVTSQG
jgi:hypothetical protein